MTFTKKQWIFFLLSTGGAVMIGAGIGIYQSEAISLTLCIIMCIVGCIMLVASGIFLHRKMRCSFCHRIYPLYCWWGMEYCPYCGEYLD